MALWSVRVLALLLCLLLNSGVMSQNDISDNSYVSVDGSCAADMDFVIKVGIPEIGGSKKYRRLRLETLVDSSTGKVDIGRLNGFLETRTPGEASRAEFSYRDVDGDECVITTTNDLLEGIKQFTDKGYLKLDTSFRETDRASGSDPSLTTTHPVGSDPNTQPTSSYKDRVLRARNGPAEKERDQEVEEDMDEASQEVLRVHLLGRFQDHYNLDNPRYFFLGEDLGDAWAALTKYQLNGKTVKSSYFAMDDVYLDLTQGPWPDEEYFVRMGIPTILLIRIADQMAGVTSAPPPATSLDPVIVAFDPSIKLVTMGEDLVRKTEGLLTDVIEAGLHRHFYRASGVFTVMNDPNGLTVTLHEVVVFSAHDEVLEGLVGDDPGCGGLDDEFEDGMGASGWTMNYTYYSGEDF